MCLDQSPLRETRKRSTLRVCLYKKRENLTCGVEALLVVKETRKALYTSSPFRHKEMIILGKGHCPSTHSLYLHPPAQNHEKLEPITADMRQEAAVTSWTDHLSITGLTPASVTHCFSS